MYNYDQLKHYGVLGVKWGIRRYQNYDGSYTKKGLARYNKKLSEYESLKIKKKNGLASRDEVRKAKRELNSAYRKLSNDKKADQGKALYAKGKTITTNTGKAYTAEIAIIAGSGIVNRVIASTVGDTKIANISSSMISMGGTAVNAIIAGKASYENSRLRAYYAHKS